MRVILQKDEQIKFIRDILSKISVSEAASLCGLSERTIRDWRRGKFTLDLVVTEILCKKTGILFPKIAELKDDYWYVALGSSLGAKTVLQKYGHVGGDPEYRKQKWFEWWEREGKIKNLNTGILARKPFKKPIFSEDLAEFVGILLGDGCISKNQINIAFNSEDENGYLPFVGNLVSKLFDVPFGIYKKIECNAVCLNISRTQLIEFLVQEVGLKRGNKVKQQVGVPAWIQNSREYLIACVRGLFDTDGSVFTHSYRVKDKIYHYKKLSFSNRSRPLLDIFYNFFKCNNFSPRMTKDQINVRLDSIKDVKKYFELVRSHNPRYLNKYLS